MTLLELTHMQIFFVFSLDYVMFCYTQRVFIKNCLDLQPGWLNLRTTVYSYGFLFNCTTVDQASGLMTALT